MTELLTSDQIFIRKLTEIVHANLGNFNISYAFSKHDQGYSLEFMAEWNSGMSDFLFL